MIHQDFIHPNFLLDNDTAFELYYRFAENKPVIDFSCMLSSGTFNNMPINNIDDLWINNDAEKSQLVQSFNRYIPTKQSKSYKSKPFMQWAQAVEYSAGSSSYHLAHLELARIFNIQELLSAKTAQSIYNSINDKLKKDNFSTISLLEKFNVEKLLLNTDPLLTNFIDTGLSEIIPSFDITELLNFDDSAGLHNYLKKAEEKLNTTVSSFHQILNIIEEKHNLFQSLGCTTMYLQLNNINETDTSDKENIDYLFLKIKDKKQLSSEEISLIKSHLISFIVDLNYKKQWTQVINVNNNSYKWLINLLYEKQQKDLLPKTLVNSNNDQDYNNNNTNINHLHTSYLRGNVHYQNINNILNTFSQHDFIRNICGYSAGAQNILSLSRHEYFRRLICNYIGSQVEKGYIPDDEELLRMLIESIIYNNTKSYFNF